MKKTKQFLSLFLAVIMAVSIAACGGPSESDENVTPPTGTPGASQSEGEAAAPEGIVPGSVVNYCVPSDIVNYLPTTTTSNPSMIVCGAVFEGLMWYPQGTGEPEPCLAESYEVSPDGLTYTFKLREGVYFTNGEEFTSADVAYSWEARKSFNASEFSNIAGWECPDDYTFVVNMTTPRATFIGELCEIYWRVVSKKAYEEYGFSDNKAAVGTGPYYVEEYVPGAYLTLKANENYWNKEYMPHIETINMEIITDANTAFIALQSGDIDMLQGIDSIQKSLLESDDSYTIYAYPDTCIDTLFFNTSCAPFDDIEVRKALSYLINKEDVVAAAFDGEGVPSNSIWPSNSSMYCTDEEISQYYTYDVEKGLQILQDAGYAPSDISFEILAPSSSSKQVAAVENIQAQLMGLGMNVTITTYDRPTYMSYIRDQDYQCAIHDVGVTLDQNNAWANSFLSDGLNHFNNFAASDPEFQQTIDEIWYEASACSERADQDAILKDGLLLLAEHYAYLPLVEKSSFYATNSGLNGMIVSSAATIRFYGLYWDE